MIAPETLDFSAAYECLYRRKAFWAALLSDDITDGVNKGTVLVLVNINKEVKFEKQVQSRPLRCNEPKAISSQSSIQS